MQLPWSICWAFLMGEDSCQSKILWWRLERERVLVGLPPYARMPALAVHCGRDKDEGRCGEKLALHGWPYVTSGEEKVSNWTRGQELLLCCPMPASGRQSESCACELGAFFLTSKCFLSSHVLSQGCRSTICRKELGCVIGPRVKTLSMQTT
jgi:hypothetical protein